MSHEGARALHFSQWFANDGGPLLVLPRELLPYWEGSDPPTTPRPPVLSEGPWITPTGDTDYDRACATDAPLAPIAVGPGVGVVVHGETDAYGVGWLHLPDFAGVYLLIPEYAEEHAETLLPAALAELPETAWGPVVDRLALDSGALMLFHAANHGNELVENAERAYAVIGEAIPCPLPRGAYTLEMCALDLPTMPGTSRFTLGRFRPLPHIS